MESHERTEGVNLRERQRLDSRKLGDIFVKASHVLGELLRGVTLERHAVLKTALDKLVSNCCACTWKRSKYSIPGKGTTSDGGVIIVGEHAEKGAERFSGGLERLPKPVLDDSFGTKDIGGEKGPLHYSVNFLFLGREGGMMINLLLFLQKQTLAFAVYLLGSVLSLPDSGLKKNTCDDVLTMTSTVPW